ncbi:MAG: branched-chain amino acid ABC transporter permease [Alphaproteobacteria bacterium]
MLELLLYGGVSSAIYALLAVGFTLIFGVARVFNLGHGSFYALGAYFTYAGHAQLKLPLLVAAAIAVALVAGIGVAMAKAFAGPLQRSVLAALMITLGFALLVEQILLLTFGSQARNVPSIIDGTVQIGAASISAQRLLTLGVGVALIAALWLFINKTRLGAAILAISQDREAAQYQGINTARIFTIVMALSAGLAAIAGVLAGSFLTVQPDMGILPMVKAVSIVIVGGLGSIPGSIIAALLLGYGETAVAFLFSTRFTELVSLGAVLLTLSLRPAGLLGKRAAF